MKECWALKLQDGSQMAPVDETGGFGIIGKPFEKLTDAARNKFGWFRCRLHNESYDKRKETISDQPTSFSFNEDANILDATYTITPLPIETLVEMKVKEINDLYIEDLYSDVTVPFPDGLSEVQFRDLNDRNNVSDLTQIAMIHIINGVPETIVRYRTKDDTIQAITAEQMVDIGSKIFQYKQELALLSWEHKDTLRSLDDLDEIADYDPKEKWNNGKKNK